MDLRCFQSSDNSFLFPHRWVARGADRVAGLEGLELGPGRDSKAKGAEADKTAPPARPAESSSGTKIAALVAPRRPDVAPKAAETEKRREGLRERTLVPLHREARKFKEEVNRLFETPENLKKLADFVSGHLEHSPGQSIQWNKDFCNAFWPGNAFNSLQQRTRVCALQLVLNEQFKARDPQRQNRGYPFDGARVMTRMDGIMGPYTVSALLNQLNFIYNRTDPKPADWPHFDRYSELKGDSEARLAQYYAALNYLNTFNAAAAPAAVRLAGSPAAALADAGTAAPRAVGAPPAEGVAGTAGSKKVYRIGEQAVDLKPEKDYPYKRTDLSRFLEGITKFYKSYHWTNYAGLEKSGDPTDAWFTANDFLDNKEYSSKAVRDAYDAYNKIKDDPKAEQEDIDKAFKALGAAIQFQQQQAESAIRYWEAPGRLPPEDYPVVDVFERIKEKLALLLPKAYQPQIIWGRQPAHEALKPIYSVLKEYSRDTAFKDFAALESAAYPDLLEALRAELLGQKFLAPLPAKKEEREKVSKANDEKLCALFNNAIWIRNIDTFFYERKNRFLPPEKEG